MHAEEFKVHGLVRGLFSAGLPSELQISVVNPAPEDTFHCPHKNSPKAFCRIQSMLPMLASGLMDSLQ